MAIRSSVSVFFSAVAALRCNRDFYGGRPTQLHVISAIYGSILYYSAVTPSSTRPAVYSLPLSFPHTLASISPRPVSSIPVPDNEEACLTALQRLNILDTEPEATFDRITTLARDLFDVSSAAVSLVGRERQWFKSMCGWTLQETSRKEPFCTYTILDDEVFVVENVAADERFDTADISSESPIQFYAGAPLCLDGDLRVGAPCLIDEEPRSFPPEQQRQLRTLADVVTELLDARRLTHQIGYLHSALEEAQGAVVITEGTPLDAPGPRIVWVNKALSRMTGYDRDEIGGESGATSSWCASRTWTGRRRSRLLATDCTRRSAPRSRWTATAYRCRSASAGPSRCPRTTRPTRPCTWPTWPCTKRRTTTPRRRW